MSKARAKGTSFETAVVEILNEEGFPDAKRPGPTNWEFGDIDGIPIVLEAKNQQTMALATWMKQAEIASQKAGMPFVVVHKRKGKNARKAYATQDFDMWLILFRAYNYCLENNIDLNA